MNWSNEERDAIFYQDLFDNSHELIHSLDEQGRFVRVNKAWKNTMGYDDEEIAGLSIWDLMRDDTLEKHRTRFQEVLRGSVFVRNQLILRAKSGEYLVLEGSSRAAFDEQGNFVCTQGMFRDVTIERQQHRKMRETLSRLQALLTQSPSGIFLFDESGSLLELSDSVQDLLETDKEDLKEKTFFDVFHEDHRGSLRQTIAALKAKEHAMVRQDVVLFHGIEKILESRIFRISCDGDPCMFGAIVNDITGQKMLEEAIDREKELFRTTLMSVGDGIISTDNEGNILMMNPVAEKLTGWSLEESRGRPLEDIFSVTDEQGHLMKENPAKQVLRTGQSCELENHAVLISKGGAEIMIEDGAAPVKDRNGRLTGAVLVFRDAREKRERQKQIEYLSFHDHLTGLYNRRYMEDALHRLDTARNLPLSIMVLDVNGLKLTNDAFGHKVGDDLLIRVAQILKNVCRSDDLIGRVGGDEFFILFPNTDAVAAETIKNRINLHAGREKLGSVIVSVAIGYTVKSSPEENVQVIQQDADNNMYRDKIKHGKSMKMGTIQAVMEEINQRFSNEESHIRNVTDLCGSMGEILKFSSKDLDLLKSAAEVHDVGKIIIPEEILNKPDAFNKEELEMVRRHPETSYQILKSVEDFATVADIALHHHERWDGRGYPQGLSGEEIPLMSRILSIADAYEAMTGPRTYRKRRSREEAIEELRRCSGSQFDPHLVEIFIEKVLADGF